MCITTRLTKYNENDFDLYFSLVKSDEVMRYISGAGLTKEQARMKFDSIIKVNDKHRELGYFKVYNVDDLFIGDAKLESYVQDPNLLEIGYILKKEYWGKGYGTMICKALLNLANEIFPEREVIGIIDPDNEVSKKLLEKFGFKSYYIGTEDGLPTEKLKRYI